jgi:hypothetical protein
MRFLVAANVHRFWSEFAAGHPIRGLQKPYGFTPIPPTNSALAGAEGLDIVQEKNRRLLFLSPGLACTGG